MRIAELSQRSGVPVATIKYYLREGLLQPGASTAPNQAQYDEHHLAHLNLIRALREGAGLSIATLGRVFDAMWRHQAHERPKYLAMGVAALSPPLEVPDDEVADYERARGEVSALLDRLAWDLDPDSPGHDDLVRALVGIHRFFPEAIVEPEQLLPYARSLRALADREIPDTYEHDVDPVAALRFAVLGTALFEPVILALRKLAHVDRIRHVDAARPTPGDG